MNTVTAEVRLSSKEGKVKAFADVNIPVGEDGMIIVSGFSVISDGNAPARVVPPARKGNTRYFDVIKLVGKIKALVDAAVLAEYNRQTNHG